EHSPPQEICPRIISAVLKQARGFWIKRLGQNTRQEPPSNVAQGRNLPRNGQSADPERHVAKRWISAKKLVPTQAGDRHFQSKFPRRFADEPGVEPIDRRLIHCCEDFR